MSDTEDGPLQPADWRRALRRARKRARLSQAALGRLAGGLAPNTICAWERGAWAPVQASVDRLREALPTIPPIDRPPTRAYGSPFGAVGPLARRPEDLAGRPPWAIALYLRRVERGMTLADLSRTSGIDIAVLSNYENGKRRPGVANERRLRAALGLTA